MGCVFWGYGEGIVLCGVRVGCVWYFFVSFFFLAHRGRAIPHMCVCTVHTKIVGGKFNKTFHGWLKNVAVPANYSSCSTLADCFSQPYPVQNQIASTARVIKLSGCGSQVQPSGYIHAARPRG